jgi:uncharacterized protein (DUF924 family)
MTPAAKSEEILAFWFGDDIESAQAVGQRAALWFAGDAAFDEQIGERFGDLPEIARAGGLESWEADARSCLALVLVTDQFPRNLYRGSGRSFEFDPLASRIACAALDRGFDRELHPVEASFLYLPLEHAEDEGLQARCVDLFRSLLDHAPDTLRPQFERFLDYAIRHREVIDRFGRFPHRNELLGRASTAEEIAYLGSGGDVFGGTR